MAARACEREGSIPRIGLENKLFCSSFLCFVYDERETETKWNGMAWHGMAKKKEKQNGMGNFCMLREADREGEMGGLPEELLKIDRQIVASCKKAARATKKKEEK